MDNFAFAGFAFFIWLLAMGFGIYMTVLFVKLATRGIKALDIYIASNQKE